MSANPPDTRSGGLTERERELIDRIGSIIAQGRGANVNVTDPRVSAVQNWILGLVGAGLVAAACWVGQSVWGLSSTLSAAVSRLDQYGTILQDHEQRLRQEERKP